MSLMKASSPATNFEGFLCLPSIGDPMPPSQEAADWPFLTALRQPSRVLTDLFIDSCFETPPS